MGIKIQIRSGTYSYLELQQRLKRHFPIPVDIERFIEAMVTTGQITKERNRYILPESDIVPLKTTKYLNFGLISGGGSGRLAIREGRDWVDKYGVPTEMYISKAWINGRWVNIREKPFLRIVKGRMPLTIEAWRAQIPTTIKRKYNIDINDYIRVGINIFTKDYFSRLQLWGYKFREMTTFEYEAKKLSDRLLELDGQNFVNEVTQDISKDTDDIRNAIKAVMLGLLENADREYHALLILEDFKENAEGSEQTPLSKRTSLFPKVTFKDLAKNRLILGWSTSIDFDYIPIISDFNPPYSNISEELKRKRFENRGGF